MNYFLNALCSIALVISMTSIAQVQFNGLDDLPLIADVKISPDGNKIAYLQASGGKYILAKNMIGAKSNLSAFAIEEGDIRSFTWVSNDHIVVYMSVPYFSRGDYELFTMWRAGILNVNTNEIVYPFNGVKFRFKIGAPSLISSLPHDPNHILMSHYEDRHEVYKINIQDGSRDKYDELGGAETWKTDNQGNIIFYRVFNDELGEEISFYKESSETGFKALFVDIDGKREFFTPYIYGFDKNGTDIYYIGKDEEKGDVFYQARIEKNIVVDPKIIQFTNNQDILQILSDDYLGYVAGLSISKKYLSTYFIDKTFAQVQADLVATFPNAQVEITSYDKNKQRWVVSISGASYGIEYYLYDTKAGSISLLASAYPNYNKKNKNTIKQVSYKAEDGVEIFAYLTEPPANINKKVLIVLAHGGPASHDSMAFDWQRQFFAAQGFTVFQPNFRGSSGYGDEFKELGFGEWGQKMQQDIDTGTQFILDKKIVDAGKVCIVGSSYGGYAAQVGAVKRPDLYQCAISFGGISSLEDLFLHTKQQKNSISYWLKSIGDRFDNEYLERNSPYNLINSQSSPMLLMHGEDDTVVPSAQSRKMYKKIKKVGLTKKHKFIPIDDADHWFSGGHARKVFLTESYQFITEKLAL